ncbi:unnamed protein product [Brassica oleracea]
MSEVRMLALSPMLMLLLSLLMASFFDTTAGQIGVCYGEYGNNLPSNSEAVAMYKQYNIRRMRMYGPNPNALDALRGSNIELSSTFPMATYNVSQIAKRRPAHGSETTSRSTTMSDSAGLSNIKVSTTTFMGAFTDTYPPSRGRFSDEFLNFLQPVVGFLNGSPRRPGKAIETYIFAMFDENEKPNDETERYFGLFLPTTKQLKYVLSFSEYQMPNLTITETRGEHFTRYLKPHPNPNPIRKTRTEVAKYLNGYQIRRDWISKPERVISESEWISEDNRTYV